MDAIILVFLCNRYQDTVDSYACYVRFNKSYFLISKYYCGYAEDIILRLRIAGFKQNKKFVTKGLRKPNW